MTNDPEKDIYSGWSDLALINRVLSFSGGKAESAQAELTRRFMIETRRSSRVMTWLTVVLVVLTLVIAWLTWVLVQREVA